MTRPRVAAFTPGPPLRSGGAVYAGRLLPALGQHVDLVAVSPSPIAWDGPTVPPDDPSVDTCDVVIHFLADNPDHLFAYRSALRRRGVVVCHELLLPHLLRGSASADEIADLMEHFGPESAVEIEARRTRGVATHCEAYLLIVVNRALRRAEAAIVHSRFARFALEAELPGLPVFRVPTHTAAVPPDLGDPQVLRAELGLPQEAFLVGLFGYLGGHKRVSEALRGFARAVPIARRHHVDLRLVVVGTEVSGEVSAALRRFGLGRLTTQRGPLDDRGFFEHMAAIDVLVNLRYPTLGETSATMIQAMQLGKPVITTDHAQLGEERAAVRIPPDDEEPEGIARALVTLATCPGCRSSVAAAGRARAEEGRIEATSEGYLRVIDSVLRARRSRLRGSATSRSLVGNAPA